MVELFLEVLNMSIRASWVLLGVMVLRLLLLKAPTWFSMTLWAVAAVRLICPLSIPSAVSLIPSVQTVDPGIMMDLQPTIDSGVPILDQMINPLMLEAFAPTAGASMNPLQFWVPFFALVWLMGAAAMFGYMIFSYCCLHRRVSSAVHSEGCVYVCKQIRSPFVLGILKPKIYLPFGVSKADQEHVISHELAHIRRLDHWWKPIGFLILTVHWFNPFVWFAYVRFCRDIEVACDKTVIKQLSHAQRADYSQALLNCCTEHNRISACPVAFGEIGIQERVKNILNYKRPAFWLILIAAVACVVAVFCLLTDPDHTDVPTAPSTSESVPAATGEGPQGLPTPQV